MAFRMRTAGRINIRSADGGIRPALFVLAAGVAAVMTGVTILGASLAPLFGVGDETSTVIAQPEELSPVTGSIGPLVISDGSNGRLATPPPPPPVAGAAVVDAPVNGVAFKMRIAALHYSADVAEGVDRKALGHGPGHYPTTAWPGREGTVGVAAHNIYWLSFNRLKAGDTIELQSTFGLFIYEITGSRITVASDVGVLAATSEHRLTLTTCYPLWAGALASKRLVFFAREIGGVARANPAVNA